MLTTIESERKIREESTRIDFELFNPTSIEEYLPFYLKWFNNQTVRRNLDPQTPDSEEGIRKWLTQKTNSNNSYYFILYDGDKIGHVGAEEVKGYPNLVEVSCVIGEEDYIGKGIGLSVMFLHLNKIFKEKSQVDGVLIVRVLDSTSHLLKYIGCRRVSSSSPFNVYVLSKTCWVSYEQQVLKD